jgi:hypothetical protein
MLTAFSGSTGLPESKEDNAARGAATVLKTDVYPCTLMQEYIENKTIKSAFAGAFIGFRPKKVVTQRKISARAYEEKAMRKNAPHCLAAFVFMLFFIFSF